MCSVCLRFTAYFVRRFFLGNKIFSQPTVKYFTHINQKCYFLLWLFQLRWTFIQHIQVFHVNKANTCFALESSLKSHVTSKREYHKDKMAGLSRWNQLAWVRKVLFFQNILNIIQIWHLTKFKLKKKSN
jgi:hypothetical protein